MKVSRSPLKILLVIPLLIIAYLLFIELVNFSLDKFKKHISSFPLFSGFSVEFENIKLSPSLLFVVENAKVSNQNFVISFSKANLSLDFRKLILERIPVNLISISNVSIQVLNQTFLESQQTQETSNNIFELIQKLKNTKLSAKEITLLSEGIELKINESDIKVQKDGSIVFDTKTQVKLGTRKIVRLFHSIIQATGYLTLDTNGNINNISSTLYLTSNEILGIITKDIKLSFSKSQDKIEGIALSKEYYGFVEIDKNRINGEVFINNLLEEASQVEEFRNISKLKAMIPEINDIAEEILKDTTITFDITPQNILVSIDSKNLKGLFQKTTNSQKISLSYIPSSTKYLFINSLDENFEVKLRNFSFSGEKLDLNLSMEISDYLLITKSYIKTRYLTGNIFDNLKLQNNTIYISNDFLYGRLNFDTTNGNITIEKQTIENFLKDFIPINLELPKMTLIITPKHTVIYGVNENIEISVKSISNILEINKFFIKNHNLLANGKIYLIKDRIEGTILLNYKGFQDNISIVYTPSILQITSPRHGTIRSLLKNSITFFDINNIPIGELQLKKISGFVSNNNIYLDSILSLYDISANLKIQGQNNSFTISKGYIYTKNKALEVVGNLKITPQTIEGNLSIDKSQISFQTKDLSSVYISGTLNKLFLSVGLINYINGTIRAKLNLSESNIISFLEEGFADIEIQTEGLFNRVKISFVKQENLIKLNSQIFNYFNIFFLNLNSDNQNNISGQILVKNRLIRQSKIQSLANISGKTFQNKFEGKIKVSIEDFSNLNENWEKNITISPDSISMYGYGDGLNIYYSKESILVSYIRNKKIIYEVRGFKKNDNITGEITGEIPLDFLVIPDFLERLEGKIEFENAKFNITDRKINISGKTFISAKNLKLALINETFQIPKTPIEIQDNKIGFKSSKIIGQSKEIIADGIVDLTSIDNPILDIKLSQTKGTIPLKITLGELNLEGDALSYIRIAGSISLPTIEGKVKFLKNSKVEYIILPSTVENEFWGYNFAQISEWKLEIEFEKSQFVSQILEGTIENGNVEVRGSIVRNNLSLRGYANLTSGTLKYLGKYFSIDSVQLIFQGNEMDFIPFINGTLYTFTYDNKTEENIKIIMNVSGKLNTLKSSFRSEPERTQSEIALLLGIPYEFGTTVKQGISLAESIGIYELLSYNIRRYTGLDVFSLRSPILSTYLNSLLEGRYYLTTRDLIKGTEISIGKQITPNLLLQYRVSLDVIGNENVLTNVFLHNFIIGLNVYDLLFELQYSSSLKENQVLFEPKLNVRYNRRF